MEMSADALDASGDSSPFYSGTCGDECVNKDGWLAAARQAQQIWS